MVNSLHSKSGMPLDEYQRKRDFSKTPEPSGERQPRARTTRTPEPLYFCVQKHLASWLLIKHRDVWSGPIDIATFAPLSVKSEGDFDDILAADMPDVWVTGRPANARGGATARCCKTSSRKRR